ncbi:transposable element Tc1 transposase [Trichonephila clavipes]|nr:transposable element Tc1 transposase [Trichonephila clavipes]
MHPRRNKKKFQQLTEFERGMIIGLREGRFSYRAIGARVQWKSSTVMRVWKKWTKNIEQLDKLAVDDGRRFAARWSTAAGVLSRLRLLVDVCCTVDCVQGCLFTGSPFETNHQQLRLQWAHEHRARQADWHQIVSFLMNPASIYSTMMSAFVLDTMPVKATFQSKLSKDLGT